MTAAVSALHHGGRGGHGVQSCTRTGLSSVSPVSSVVESIDDPPRALIADDHVDVLQALSLLLATDGMSSELVTSPAGVIAALQGSRFDVVVMDLNYARDTTSGREGLDLVSQIRAIDDRLPIVVMTGWGSVDGAVEAMRLGASDYVQKPWDNQRLVDTLRSEVGRARARRQGERLRERAIADAHDTQRRLLPHAFPDIPGWTIAATWLPAGEVGGDYFDVLPVGGNACAIAIADVVGKGVPAALLMAHLQGTVRAAADAGLDPGALCARVNDELGQRLAPGKFVSFCYATLDADRTRLRYANAGHNPPMLVRRSGEIVRLDRGGPVLGVFGGLRYDTAELTLEPGDRLVFFTDGVVESRDAADEEFGDDRLASLAAEARELDTRGMQERLIAAASEFCRGSFADDATLLVVGQDR